MISLYPNCVDRDRVRKCALRLPGTAIFNSDIMRLEEWLDTEYYHYFKFPLELHQTSALIYDMPFQRERKFSMTYFSNFSKTFDVSLRNEEIEFFTFPIYLAWLYRCDLVDRETLSDWFETLVGMTPVRLVLLREMVNIGRYQNAAIGSKMAVSEGVIRNYIAQAYEAANHLLPEPEFPDANMSQVIDLVRLYDFLRLAGRPCLTLRTGMGLNNILQSTPGLANLQTMPI